MNSIPRRTFVRLALNAGALGVFRAGFHAAGAEFVSPLTTLLSVDDAEGVLGQCSAPVAVKVPGELAERARKGPDMLPVLHEIGLEGEATRAVPAQWMRSETEGGKGRLAWMIPPGARGRRAFRVRFEAKDSEPTMRALRDERTGQYELHEGAKAVLHYNYATIEPGALLERVSPANRRYAVARSDYIHPLFGPHGEVMTLDWPIDHPHHRGIYWAWPEVDWRGQRGDLHALQKVFARPTGQCRVSQGAVFAQLEAENLWRWEDREPIVRELALIRVWRASKAGRVIDLVFRFEALKEPVLIARRHTDLYGGLNVRLNAVEEQRIVKHNDPPSQRPLRSWGQVSGRFGDAAQAAGLVILQLASNPDYPGDWVDYPNLNWLQPTFPRAGTRHRLEPGQPLVLRYRLYIHADGAASEPLCAAQWRAANAPLSPLSSVD